MQDNLLAAKAKRTKDEMSVKNVAPMARDNKTCDTNERQRQSKRARGKPLDSLFCSAGIWRKTENQLK